MNKTIDIVINAVEKKIEHKLSERFGLEKPLSDSARMYLLDKDTIGALAKEVLEWSKNDSNKFICALDTITTGYIRGYMSGKRGSQYILF